MVKVTRTILRQATGATQADADKFYPYINPAMRKYRITTPARALAFLSQIGHESGGLKYTTEVASGAAYEGRKDLGNIQPGDGMKFKGRGVIQITGRSNYAAVSKALGKDFINHPELLAIPKYAVEASAWWWQKHGLNELADKMDLKKPLDDPQNKAVFAKITKVINGGYNGLADRSERWNDGQDIVVAFAKKYPVQVALGVSALALGITTVLYYSINKNEIKLAA